MSTPAPAACQCLPCQQGGDHPDRTFHRQLNLLFGRLEENQRRWLAALEADKFGHGGDRLMAQISGLDEKTIRRGRQELAGELEGVPVKRVRRPGGGRPRVEKKIRPS
jgi:hypothetical protein